MSHIVRPFCCSAQIVFRHATGRTFCMMPVTNYWIHSQFPYHHNIMLDTLKVVMNFKMLINDTFLSIRLCIFNFGHCKLRFSSTTLREWGFYFDNPCEILQALRQQRSGCLSNFRAIRLSWLCRYRLPDEELITSLLYQSSHSYISVVSRPYGCK